MMYVAMGYCIDPHLDERVHFSDGWDVLRDEALQQRVQLNFVGLVPLNILKQISNFRRHVQMAVVLRIVCTLDVVVALLLPPALGGGLVIVVIAPPRAVLGRRRRGLLRELLLLLLLWNKVIM